MGLDLGALRKNLAARQEKTKQSKPHVERQQIIERNPLVEYLRARGHELWGSGENFVTNACPVEAHKKPGHRPVSIEVGKQVWYCNDHKVGGSVIDWEATEKKSSIGSAMQSLNGDEERRFVCAYDYVDETGEVLFRKFRYSTSNGKLKTFELRQPNGTRNIKGVRRVLYHLPQVIAAKLVLNVEGEKDADTVSVLGFTTTTNYDGAGKWRPEYCEILRGKDVVLIGDNDEEGLAHVKKLIPTLSGFVHSLRQAKVPGPFKDVSDYLVSLPQSDRKEAIQKLIDEAKDVSPAPDAERFKFAELMAFDSKHDPNCLVGNRYLVRGGSSLWAGGSGYGKSALQLQLAVYWACGVPCFGLRPVRSLKSLIIQAENDLGDMGEQLQGVIAGIDASGDLDIQEKRDLIEKNIGIYRAIGKSGSVFLELLDALIVADRPDFVWIDPLFAFAGCDLMNAASTGHFIRDGLFPIAARRSVALNVVHHVGKPVRDPQAKHTSNSMAEIDFQYLGFGTSEIQNAFRAVNILVPVSNTGKFRLVLSKRGERAGAKDTDGEWCRSIYMEHSKQGICWMQCEKPEKATKGASKLKYTHEHILDAMSVAVGAAVKELHEGLKEDVGMSSATFYRLWDSLKKQGQIRLNSENKWIKNTA